VNEQTTEIHRAFMAAEISFSQAVERLIAIGLSADDAHQTVVGWTLGNES
jgi:hypothetical protein